MPLYDYICPVCHHRVTDVYQKTVDDEREIACTRHAAFIRMQKDIVVGVHSKIDDSMDGADLGKNVKEKNEQLKKMHAGYSYEEAALRKRTEEFIQNKIEQGQI